MLIIRNNTSRIFNFLVIVSLPEVDENIELALAERKR